MKLLKFNEFINEDFDICVCSQTGKTLEVGDPILGKDGYSTVIISKDTSNGTVSYKGSDGEIYIVESIEIEEDTLINPKSVLRWWELTRALVFIDYLKVGKHFRGGSIRISSEFKAHKEAHKNLDLYKSLPEYKEHENILSSIITKCNADNIIVIGLELNKYKLVDLQYCKTKTAIKIGKNQNSKRHQLILDLTFELLKLLSEDEVDFIQILVNVGRGKISENELSQLSMLIQDPSNTAISSSNKYEVGNYFNT